MGYDVMKLLCVDERTAERKKFIIFLDKHISQILML